MNKDQHDDLVLNYCYAIFDDMNNDQIRSFIIDLLYREKICLTPDQLIAEVKEKYPELCN